MRFWTNLKILKPLKCILLLKCCMLLIVLNGQIVVNEINQYYAIIKGFIDAVYLNAPITSVTFLHSTV